MLQVPVVYPLFILPSVGPLEAAVVFMVVLILFGPGKLPEVFRALGQGVRQFKDAASGSPALPAASEPPVLSSQEKS
jgi:sec-independent protein translocase protein TatA